MGEQESGVTTHHINPPVPSMLPATEANPSRLAGPPHGAESSRYHARPCHDFPQISRVPSVHLPGYYLAAGLTNTAYALRGITQYEGDCCDVKERTYGTKAA